MASLIGLILNIIQTGCALTAGIWLLCTHDGWKILLGALLIAAVSVALVKLITGMISLLSHALLGALGKSSAGAVFSHIMINLVTVAAILAWTYGCIRLVIPFANSEYINPVPVLLLAGILATFPWVHTTGNACILSAQNGTPYFKWIYIAAHEIGIYVAMFALIFGPCETVASCWIYGSIMFLGLLATTVIESAFISRLFKSME